MAKKDNLSIPEHEIAMEIVEVKADYLMCEFRDDIHYTDEDGKADLCAKCDEGRWKQKDLHEDAPSGFTDAKTCRESYDCKTDSVVKVAVAKPIALQARPWDKKTIKYNAGLSDEFTIVYTYDGTNPQRRLAKYSDENARCTEGDHIEIVWPAYNVRIDPAGGNNKKAAGYVKGDMIRVLCMARGLADVGVQAIIDKAKDKEKARKDMDPDLKQAQHFIDQNVDGRKWEDDCGKGGAGGGSVWV